MTERNQPTQETSENVFSEIENQILTKYYGELGFHRVLNASKNKGYTSGLEILAKNYNKLSENKKKQVTESLDYLPTTKKHDIKLQAACALSKLGDFSLAEVTVLEKLQVDRYTIRSVGQSLIDIGIAKAEKNEIGDVFFENAYQLVYKQDNDYDAQMLSASVIKAVAKVGGNPEYYLADSILRAKTLDKKNKNSNYMRKALQKTLARELASRELFEEAKKVDPQIDVQHYQNNRWNMFREGQYNEAMKGIKEPKDILLMATKISRNLLNEGKSPENFIHRMQQSLKKNPKLADMNSELIFAQYNFTIGKNSQEHFKKAFAFATSETEVIYKIESLRDVIKVQHATTGVPNESFKQLNASLEKGKVFLEDLGPDADKLDRLETLMTFENTSIALAELGYMEEAIKAYESTLQLYKTYSPEESSESFSLDFYAQLALTDLNDKRVTITQQNLEKLCRETDNKTLKAIGYLDLVNINTFKKLPVEKQIAIAIGTRQRDNIDVMRQEKKVSGQDLKIALQNILGQESEGSIAELRTLLVEEVKSESGDYRIIARITKGLIEKGDEKGKTIAATLFSESSLPEEIRIYIAKKLCESGYWDPQIIDHFKNYKSKGEESTTLEKINIETLEAIVNQMHATPSLAIYKVLEATRLNKNEKQLQALTEFGTFVFMVPNLSVEGKIKMFSEKAELFNQGKLTIKELDKIREGYHDLRRADL